MDISKTIVAGMMLLVALGAMNVIFMPKPGKYTGRNMASAYASVVSSKGSAVSQKYQSQSFGFSTVVPPGFTIDETYTNQSMGEGKQIPGVAFRVPPEVFSGTNLSPDSYVAVESLYTESCTPLSFLALPRNIGEEYYGNNGFVTAFSVSSVAGNIYEERVHVIKEGGRCYNVRYFIHYMDSRNYPSHEGRDFDKEGLISLFDIVKRNFIIH